MVTSCVAVFLYGTAPNIVYARAQFCATPFRVTAIEGAFWRICPSRGISADLRLVPSTCYFRFIQNLSPDHRRSIDAICCRLSTIEKQLGWVLSR